MKHSFLKRAVSFMLSMAMAATAIAATSVSVSAASMANINLWDCEAVIINNEAYITGLNEKGMKIYNNSSGVCFTFYGEYSANNEDGYFYSLNGTTLTIVDPDGYYWKQGLDKSLKQIAAEFTAKGKKITKVQVRGVEIKRDSVDGYYTRMLNGAFSTYNVK